ncbi:MAG: aminomethyl-transferring glycine dehydrogenase subunit GcvPA [Desulfovibrionaceae bacterium]|nr:aminomethyl-transferring glycine dehydrogenase subunit GcvPA [Desulfovibrionaceae bacterium]
MPYIPHTQAELEAMLGAVGVKTLDDLFADIAPDLRPRKFLPAEGMTEQEVRAKCERLAGANKQLLSFLGAGYYDHAIPSAVDALAGQSAFVTAYTPYQAECSQGTLQAIFEFQTAVTRLMEMDCANASLYDGGSALFEASTMCVRASRNRSRIVIDEGVNPIWRKMLATYAHNLPMEFVLVPHRNGAPDKDALKAAIDDKTAGVVVQNPNFFGVVADYADVFAAAHAVKALGVIAVNPVMQSVLKTPGAMGADIAVAEGQGLGLPLSFGGPYLGLMACTKALVRQMPGRLVGRTHDKEGRTGYVLTLQAREQHIRRAKATSNICSNQSLCALRCLIYLSLMGPQGLADVAESSMSAAHLAVERLTSIPGVSLLNDQPYANEAALVLPVPAEAVVRRCMASGHRCVPGYPAVRAYKGLDNVLVLACTEKHTAGQMETLVCDMARAIADIQADEAFAG